MKLRATLLPLLLAGWITVAIRAEPTVAEPPLELPANAEADRQALADIWRAHDVVTTPHQPGPQRYLRDVSTALQTTIAAWLGRALPGFTQGVGRVAGIAVWVLFAVVASLLSWLVWRWMKARRWRVAGDDGFHGATADPVTAPPHRDWWAEIERHLAAGTAREALEALWHWLARRLVDGPVDASWTSRELVRRSGREDLLPAVRRLDRWLYGGVPPEVGEVRELRDDLQERAARGTS